jgi:hypothetical protein
LVNTCVEGIGVHVTELKGACDELDGRLRQADDATKHLLQQANGIRKQHAMTLEQADLLALFLERFTLTEKEVQVIESNNVPVGTPLFDVMDKLERIRRESQVLLVGQDEGAKAGMRAGIEVLEEASALVDKGQHKIARWLYAEMRSFAREGVDVGQHIREAVQRLDGREDLLRPALQTLSSARAQLLSTAFQRALTVGGPAPSFLPRPIEMHAHDPMRYVGDMLAWVHQAVASEREFLSLLFSKIGELKSMEGMRRVGQRRRGLEGSIDWTGDDTAGMPKSELWTRESVDKVLEGCCQPLQRRIEQTTLSQEGCITTFKLATLIQFYRVTMERTLGSRSALSRTLKALSLSTYHAFIGTIDRQADGLARFDNAFIENDLSVPAPVLGATATLKELLAAHQASLSEADLFGDALPLKDLKADELRDFSAIVERLATPILLLSRRLADTFTTDRTKGKADEKAQWRKSIFSLNCLAHLKAVLEPYHFTAKSMAIIDESLDQAFEDLVNMHHKNLCSESGLDEFNIILERSSPLVDSDAGQILAALTDFESFLGSPSLISSPDLNLLNSPTLRANVHSKALELVARDYERMTGALQGSNTTMKGLEDVPIRDPIQIRLLLGIESRS